MHSIIHEGLEIRADYSEAAGIYRILPCAVARPAGLAELRAVLSEAKSRGWPVTPRGAGTAMGGSNLGGGLILDLTAFDADQLSIDPERRLAIVSPSVTLAALQAAAATHGLRFGPDPSSARWATLGGMISTNAAGARSYRLGASDQWVMALMLETEAGPLELARGLAPDSGHPVVRRWLDLGAPLLTRHRTAVEARWPRTRKNAAGYGLDRYYRSGELLELVIGAEGTLGIVTQATLRLEPAPSHRLALRIALASRADLSRAIDTVALHAPTTIELLDATYLELVPRDTEVGVPAAVLLVDFEGDDAADIRARGDATVTALAALALDVVVALDAATQEDLWAMRHAVSPTLNALGGSRRSLQVIEDGCVPVARLGEYLQGVEWATRRAEVDAVMFGHAGDGHVHVNLLPDLAQPDWLARVRQVFGEVSDLVYQLGGTPTGEHGAGRLRAGLLPHLLGPEALECFRAIKTVFDPEGRFNPGVILSDGGDPLVGLKVDKLSFRIPLPDDACASTTSPRLP